MSSKRKKETSNETKPAKKQKTNQSTVSPPAVALDSNWNKLKQTLPPPVKKEAQPQPTPKWVVEREKKRAEAKAKAEKLDPPETPKKPLTLLTNDSTQPTKLLALDCEMVGVGPGGIASALAQVTIINSYGNIVYTRYVRPLEAITDYRTEFSGIRKSDLRKALDFKTVQKEVADLIQNRIVVGHGLKNDFDCLMLSHPFRLTRDTATYRPLQRARGLPFSLKYLSNKYLKREIQSGEHDPAEDARAALALYKMFSKEWEAQISKKGLKTKQKSTEENEKQKKQKKQKKLGEGELGKLGKQNGTMFDDGAITLPETQK